MNWIRQNGVLVAFALLFMVSAIAQPTFLNPENLILLIYQNVDAAFIAIGMKLVIVGAGIDLSVGSLMALSAAAGLSMMNKQFGSGEPVAVAFGVVTMLGVGTGLGLLNGLVVAYGRLAPFVVTLCGLVAYRSIALVTGNSGEIRSMSVEIFPTLAKDGLMLGNIKLAYSVFVMILVAIAAHILLERTRYGRSLVAIGSNERAAFFSALPVARVKFISYAILGFCCGLAAIFSASRLNSLSTGNAGMLAELDAIAAVVIGGASLSGGKGRILNTLLGVLILAMINNLLILNSIGANWQGFVKGAIILLAVLVQRERRAH